MKTLYSKRFAKQIPKRSSRISRVVNLAGYWFILTNKLEVFGPTVKKFALLCSLYMIENSGFIAVEIDKLWNFGMLTRL